jgi:hypothetical protein
MAYPATITTFSTKVDGAGNTILAAHMNAVQTDITAIETELGTDPAGTLTDVKTRLAVSLANDGDLRLTGSSTLTISGGVVTATNNLHQIDTEGAAASDTLDTINGGADGYVLVISLASASHAVILSHNTGNIDCVGGRSLLLDTENDLVILVYSSALSKWRAMYGGGAFLNQDNSFTASNVFNEGGAATADFRVESDTEANMIFVDANADTDGAIYLGGTTNGVKIAKGGNLNLLGTATQYEDLRIAGSAVRTGATAPTVAAFGPSGALYALRFDSGQHDEVFFEIQMPHSWKEGTNIYPHVHWTPVSATAGNVVWELDYSWANINGTFGAPTTITSDPTAAGGTAWVHKLSVLKDGGGNAYIDGTGMTLSSMLVCRLHRNAGAGSDTLAAGVNFLEFDIHYEVDSFGSNSEYIK